MSTPATTDFLPDRTDRRRTADGRPLPCRAAPAAAAMSPADPSENDAVDNPG